MSNDSKQPKGPPKPWDPEMEQAAEEFVGFLKDPEAKQNLKDFLIQTFKEFESKRIDQFKARLENEKQVDSNRIQEFHNPGNITSLVSEHLSMNEAEHAFARGIRYTKSNMIRCLDDKVEEINRLLAGIGGFSSQLKSCFARSTVVFLEQEDPRRSFRERLIFSINLPNYELKMPWDRSPGATNGREGKVPAGAPMSGDGRTPLQATWDNAVNALAHIISDTGLKPKYCKNDRHYGRFVMKQDLRHNNHLPDEYFSLTLDYNTAEKIREMIKPYNRIVRKYNRKLHRLERWLNLFHPESKSRHYAMLKKKYLEILQERDYFLGTTPDPNQLDEGLLFLIEVSTLNDYHIVKDRMQSIMTNYILHLSKIAANDAEIDPDLEHDLWKMRNQERRAAERPRSPDSESAPRGSESLPEYEVNISHLRPVQRKKNSAA